MVDTETPTDDRSRGWLPWSGVAAMVGALLSTGLPWMQIVVFATRPYAASAFDVGSLVGWLLMLIGLVGVHATFADRIDRLGRSAIGSTAAGMALVSALLFRRVVLFADAGFRSVPATGEGPADLLLSNAAALGFGLTLIGAGGIGVALRRSETRHTATAWLLLLGPGVPLALLLIDSIAGLPVAIGRLVVTADTFLVPFCLGWAALGATVRSRARSGPSETPAERRGRR